MDSRTPRALVDKNRGKKSTRLTPKVFDSTGFSLCSKLSLDFEEGLPGSRLATFRRIKETPSGVNR